MLYPIDGPGIANSSPSDRLGPALGGARGFLSVSVRLRDLLSGRRAAAGMLRMVLAASDVGGALDVVQTNPVAALGVAVDLAPHDHEDREFAETTTEASPEQVPP